MSRASNAGSRVGSAKSGMSEARRERLMDIQKREQLKGMLISKFKLKYGDKPQISKYIDNEVTRFLKNGRLTEDNLRSLDTKINKEAEKETGKPIFTMTEISSIFELFQFAANDTGFQTSISLHVVRFCVA